MEIRDVLTAIVAGDLDDDLERVWDALNDREKVVREQKARLMSTRLEKGARVAFSDTIRPMYLRGLQAVVDETPRPGEKVSVKVVEEHRHQADRFGRGSVKVPADLLVLVDG